MHSHPTPPVRPARPSPWVVLPRPNPGSRLRLFCFPFAGGGASIYSGWPPLLPPEVELVAVQLPGREMRMAEEPIGDLAVLVERLHEALAPFMDRPFAFYGHSNGGLMAYELARSLARAGRRMPLHLFVGGRPAPQLVRNDEPLHALPHDEFIEALRRYNGTPEEVLANPEIMEIISPMLRADFALGETYVHQPGPPLHVPVSAYAGEHDAEVEPREVEAWRERTSGPFVFRVFPGDHFFMVSHRETLLAQMRDELRPLLARLAAAAHA